MDTEDHYLKLLESSSSKIQESQKEIHKLRREGKFLEKDLAKANLSISLSMANLSATKLNYYASKELKNSISKSSSVQRILTIVIIVIGALNLLGKFF